MEQEKHSLPLRREFVKATAGALASPLLFSVSFSQEFRNSHTAPQQEIDK